MRPFSSLRRTGAADGADESPVFPDDENCFTTGESTDKARLAIRRSDHLVLSLLTPAQQREYRETRMVTVNGPITGTRYRLGRVWGSVVILGDDERVICHMCIHVKGMNVPSPDNLAALLLMLHTDERAFIGTAVSTSLPPALYEMHREWRAARQRRPAPF